MQVYNVEVLENGKWVVMSSSDSKEIAEKTLASAKNYAHKMNEDKKYRITEKLQLNEG